MPFYKLKFKCPKCESITVKESDRWEKDTICLSKKCRKEKPGKLSNGMPCNFISGTTMEKIGKVKMVTCPVCKDLDNLYWECPDEPHHGEQAICDCCDAEYYRHYGGDITASNNQAFFNHQELKIL